MTISESLLARLKDRTLVQEAGFVGGIWQTESSNKKTFEITDPATEELLATLPDLDIADARCAFNRAYVSQKAWAKRTAKERSQVLRQWFDLVIANADDLAAIITAEMGKPLAEARGEVLYGASYAEWFAEEAKRTYGDIIPQHQADKRLLVVKQPIGVVAAVAPWNFPCAMVIRKVAPALAAGCSIVFKPAPETPLSSIALAVLAERAGVPSGLFSVITTTAASAFGEEACSNPKVRKITFTGSTQVGRILMRQASEQIMKVSLELGGNAPFIVFDDANIDEAVEGAMASKFRNAGQTCVCANRIFVQAAVYLEFAEKLSARVSELKVGNGFDAETTIGPLINDKAVVKVQGHIEDAIAKGGTVICGGTTSNLGRNFVPPTVLTGVTGDMRIAREETFGPVAPLFKFETVDEVIELANSTEYGLAAYFYAGDVSRVWTVAEALEFGMVGVNTGLISTEVAPFGGVKQSGVDREGSRYGIEDYMEMKYICMGGIKN